MSFKKQYIEWDVPLDEVQIGIPIGFDVELSQNRIYAPVTYRLSTHKESSALYYSRFYYSLNKGLTWIAYPSGNDGFAFYQAFKMRLEVNADNAEGLVAYSSGTVYKISADGSSILDELEINIPFVYDIGYGTKSDVLYLTESSTVYRINNHNSLKPYDNSLNVLGEIAMGVVVDEVRNSFWQINQESVCLRRLDGEKLFCVDLGEEVDIDHSSSSSSSSSSLVGNTAFISTWTMYEDEDFSLPTTNLLNYDFTINWGDGTPSEEYVIPSGGESIHHTYEEAGDYTIWIDGLFEGLKVGYSQRDNLKRIDNLGDVGWKTFNASFYQCLNLTSVRGGVTGGVTDMTSMFRDCYNLVSVDTSTWDVSSVTSMTSMFRDCNDLVEIDLGHWVTTSLTNSQLMFTSCNSLETVDVSWDYTPLLTHIDNMFSRCPNLVNIDLSSFDISTVTRMSHMFDGCSSLVTIGYSSWDANSTALEPHIYSFCEDCTALAEVPPSSAFWDKVSYAGSHSDAFKDCPLIEAGIPSSWGGTA